MGALPLREFLGHLARALIQRPQRWREVGEQRAAARVALSGPGCGHYLQRFVERPTGYRPLGSFGNRCWGVDG